MAESLKFTTLAKATEVYPDLPWQVDGDHNTQIFDSKSGEFVEVQKGQYIVSIADRYEVHDEEPAKAKPAEAPKAEEKPKADADEVVAVVDTPEK